MTLKEENARLTKLVDSQAEEIRKLTDSVASLTADHERLLGEKRKSDSDLQSARQTVANLHAAASPAPPAERSGPADDEPRWISKFEGGVKGCTVELVPDLAELKARQEAEPDTWFDNDADAIAAYHRREGAAVAEARAEA